MTAARSKTPAMTIMAPRKVTTNFGKHSVLMARSHRLFAKAYGEELKAVEFDMNASEASREERREHLRGLIRDYNRMADDDLENAT